MKTLSPSLACAGLGLAFSLSCSVFSLGCGSDAKPADENVARSDVQRDRSPLVTPGDAEALRDGNTAFAIDLYRTLRNDPAAADKNLFFSPASISIALAMTYAGARGKTESEMAATMHYTLPHERLHPAFDALDLALGSRGQGQKAQDGNAFRLRVTNSLWGAPQVKYEPPFLDVLAKSYGAGIRLTNFAQDPEAARVTINDWTSKETEDRIKDLLPAGSLSNLTRLVLVNAVYFNAAWKTPFEDNGTKKAVFHASSGDVQADMMTSIGSFPYAAGPGYRAVALPYAGDELSFVAVLPTDIDAFESTFTATQAGQIAGALAAVDARVKLPKFRIEGKSFSLKEALRSQGMKDAFETTADFKGITTGEPLSIHDVLHQAFVAVDEKGTEAAAATAVIVVGRGAPQEPVEVTFDKPFVFFVRDNATGAVLFLGRVKTL